MMTKCSALLPALLLLLCTVMAQSVNGGELLIIQPVNELSAETSTRVGQERAAAHINRTGNVKILPDLPEKLASLIEQHASGSTQAEASPLLLSFFPDRSYRISLTGSSRSRNNTLHLQGRHRGAAIASFAMTLGRDSYLINMQDMERDLLYRVVGNRETGIGLVSEIDLRKMPLTQDGDPVVPPKP